MKTNSMQFKFLITIISAILAVAVFVGGLSLYEVDKFVETETQNYINVTCEKEVSQINDDFGDMENAVHIMESYVYGLVKNDADVNIIFPINYDLNDQENQNKGDAVSIINAVVEHLNNNQYIQRSYKNVKCFSSWII